MKKRLVCCFAVLCMALSGCAGNQPEDAKTELLEPLEQKDVPQEVPSGTPAEPARAEETELDSAPDGGEFSGRWQAVESPQYYMDIGGGDGDRYTIEIIWAGASGGDIVWQAEGTYDETWEGVAYVGTKYEDAVKEDGTVDRIPVPEREEVTGMVYLEDDGTLHWIDDFDHMGDDLSFERA